MYMTDKNTVTSASLKAVKETKDAVETPPIAAKKSPAKKAAAKKIEKIAQDSGLVVVYFESGASYNSNGYRFTRQDPFQEVSAEYAEFLFTLDNFRRPDVLELEEYYASKED